jgi:hypothetical protein
VDGEVNHRYIIAQQNTALTRATQLGPYELVALVGKGGKWYEFQAVVVG